MTFAHNSTLSRCPCGKFSPAQPGGQAWHGSWAAWTAGFQPQSHLTPNAPLLHSPRPHIHQGSTISVTLLGWGIHAWKPSSGGNCPITPMPSHAVSRAPASTRLQAPWHTPPHGIQGGRGDCGRETQTGSSVTIWHPQGDVPSLVGSRAAPNQKGRDKNNMSRCGRPPFTLAQGRVLIWWHPTFPKAWPPAGERDRHRKGLTDGHGDIPSRTSPRAVYARGRDSPVQNATGRRQRTLHATIRPMGKHGFQYSGIPSGKGKIYRRRQRW